MSNCHHNHKVSKHYQRNCNQKADHYPQSNDANEKDHVMDDNAGHQTSCSCLQSSSVSSTSSRYSSSTASCSSSRSWYGENHHITDQGHNSPQFRKRTHSYCKEKTDHHPANNGSVFATYLAPGASKGKTKKDVPPKKETSCQAPCLKACANSGKFSQCNCPDWELFSDVNEVKQIKS